MKFWQDKIATITGAGRGIGQGIALHFAEEGALIAQSVSTGEMEHVRVQPPELLREVFLETPMAATS